MWWRTVFLTLLAALPLPATAGERYLIDSEHTFSSFEYLHWGLSLQRGRFDKNSGSIELDLANQSGAIQIDIDVTSVNTGSNVFNRTLLSENFFDADKYPTIQFISDKLIFNEDKLVKLEGKLSIKGISLPVSIEVTHFHCRFMLPYLKQACGANAHTKILRSDYKIGRFVPFVSDEITLYLNVEAIKE